MSLRGRDSSLNPHVGVVTGQLPVKHVVGGGGVARDVGGDQPDGLAQAVVKVLRHVTYDHVVYVVSAQLVRERRMLQGPGAA